MKIKSISVIFLVLIILFFCIGCDESVNDSDTGILLILLTDSPFPIDSVAEANVTINKIELRQDQPDSENTPFLPLSESEHSYNLLTLQNGVTADLVKLEVPVGTYDLVRLYISAAGIKLKNDSEYDLTVPSGAQTGIKIFIDPPISVQGELTTELLLDFDVSQSFIVQGNPDTPNGINGFHFNPVIRAANVSTSGTINGKVVDNSSAEMSGAYIWIDQDPIEYSGYSVDGEYTISGVPEGTYTVKASMDGYNTASLEGVGVVAGNKTQLVDFALTHQ
jgi:hypothetical protein